MRGDLQAFISTENLLHNFRVLKSRLKPGVRICAAIKADAYGHGVHIVAPVLQNAGADFAAVASVLEAVELRGLGWKPPILVLGNVLSVPDAIERDERLAAASRHDLTLTIAETQVLEFLSLRPPSKPISVHLKIDTGMGRMGVTPDGAAVLVRRIRSIPHLRLTGIYSHFATADLHDPELARFQLATFRRLLTDISDLLPPGVIRHLANSAATLSMPDAHFEMVRPGLALYGYHPAPHLDGKDDLRPILRLVSHLSLAKDLPPGHCVGYAATFVTSRPTRLGIVPVGYYDGFIRLLSGNAIIGTPAGDAPVIGRISMDQLAVDLTDLATLPLGSEITLIDDRPGRPNSVAAIARRIGTIPYEVTCLLGRRIQRLPAPDGAPGLVP